MTLSAFYSIHRFISMYKNFQTLKCFYLDWSFEIVFHSAFLMILVPTERRALLTKPKFCHYLLVINNPEGNVEEWTFTFTDNHLRMVSIYLLRHKYFYFLFTKPPPPSTSSGGRLHLTLCTKRKDQHVLQNIWGQFHQHSTSSFYARRSQKGKKRRLS